MAARWRSSLRLLADIAFLDVPGRLAKTLLTLASAPSYSTPEHAELRGITQAELASLVGTSRESVGRWLKVFEQSGAIQAGRGRLRILNRRNSKGTLTGKGFPGRAASPLGMRKTTMKLDYDLKQSKPATAGFLRR